MISSNVKRYCSDDISLIKNYDKVLSAETKSKMSAARLGKALSSDHKTAISMGLKGHKISVETRAKIYAAMKAKYK